MQLELTPEADRDIASAAEFNASRGTPDLGLRFLESAEKTFYFLSDHPGAGWRCRWIKRSLSGTRIFPVHGFRRYLVFYRCEGQVLVVLRVLHGSRNLKAILR